MQLPGKIASFQELLAAYKTIKINGLHFLIPVSYN